MKRQLLLLTLLMGTMMGTMYAQGALTPEILYYKFDGTGTTVPNYASAPPAGTATANLMGGLTQGGSNICNGTVIGTGVSSTTDYVNTGWATNLTGTSWTISMRTSNITPSGTLFYIFGDLGAGSFRCFTNGVAGADNWILRGPVGDIFVNGGATVAPHMTTFVYDITLGSMTAYLDGVQVSTTVQAAPTISSAGPFKVVGYSANVGAPVNGYLDEFRVYSRALSASEVAELYNPFAAGNFLGSDTYTCPGDTSTFDPGVAASSYLWSDGSTGDTLLVNVADTFALTVSGTCGSGIDSIIFISSVTTDSFATNTCSPTFTAPSGALYSASGVYLDTIGNSLGCDSIITINLNILSPTANTLNPFTCNPSYVAPSGIVLSSSGTFNDTIANAAGCDSIITINLTLGTASSNTITTTSCINYLSPSGNLYTSSGTYNDTILNMEGCDSLITINLTINNVNIGVTQGGVNGTNLAANAASATYQWYDCGSNTIISGETNQNFVATANGSYAVIVTENSCTDTSACFVVAGLGLNQNSLASLVQLYPNPSKGAFTVNLGNTYDEVMIELTNNVGQVIQTRKFSNTNQAVLGIEGASGLYFVKITSSNGEKATLRIIKE